MLFCSVVIGVAGFFTLILGDLCLGEDVNHLEIQEKIQQQAVLNHHFLTGNC